MDKNLFKGMLLIIISALCTAFGQLLWKIGTESGLFALLIGFILYGSGALIMIIALKYGQLSILHPLMCIGYIFTLINGYLFLDETVTVMQLIGVVIIIIGVYFIARGGKNV